MGRVFGFLYGVSVYLLFLLTFLYTIGFVGNFIVPKSIDTGVPQALVPALVINLGLLSLFAFQHSVMARPGFKRIWTKVIPVSVERSTYNLLTCVALIALIVFWVPMAQPVWDVSGTPVGDLLEGAFWAGWIIVLLSTFMINHFDLFGLRQVTALLRQRPILKSSFQKTAFYRLVRHPIMTGFLIAFWMTPIMTVGHLLFAVVTTLYIYIAVLRFEEKDLVNDLGEKYQSYQDDVGPFFPGVGKGR